MKTWEKFIPNAEIHVLDYSNMADYADVKDVYGDQLFSGSFTLPMIADAIRALILERHGGIWMDADTILTGGNVEEYLHMRKKVAFFGYPDRHTVHVAWISAQKHANLLQYWVAECARKIKTLTREDMVNPDFWSYLSNSIVNPYIQSHPGEVEIMDAMKAGCVPERNDINENAYHAYIDFYFKKSFHLNDISCPVLLLHNSWTPQQYNTLPLDQLSRVDCTMSNILMELTR